MPEIAVDTLREALRCMHSTLGLGETALADMLYDCKVASGKEPRGEILRRVLLDAIETLRPTGRTLPTASAFRAYECLTLRYISGMSVDEIAEELCLSRRQVYRDLGWGEKRLAALLAERCLGDSVALGADPGADSLSREIAALADKPGMVDLAEALTDALTTVNPLARARSITLEYSGPERDVYVTATPGILREIIIQVLSALAQSVSECSIVVELVPGEEAATATVQANRLTELARSDLLEAALRLADSQGFLHEISGLEGKQALHLSFPRSGRRQVLVVEDNPSAFALYTRYLANTEWEAVLAPDPDGTVELAVAKRAQAIILDIMMPETDGWRVLQALKLDERTRQIPVIVCSVVNDPELGLALGAASYLTKPVFRPALLRVLAETIQA